MADKARRTSAQGRKSKPLNYFYLNGDLHKKLHINRGADELTAWCYPARHRVTYPYTSAKMRMKPAFTTVETGKLLNRGRLALERAIMAGHIERPQYTYTLDENQRLSKYMWSEDDVLAAHAYFTTVHSGRPRKDGMITPRRMPTVPELKAMMRGDKVFYVRDDDGNFRPTWDAPEF